MPGTYIQAVGELTPQAENDIKNQIMVYFINEVKLRPALWMPAKEHNLLRSETNKIWNDIEANLREFSKGYEKVFRYLRMDRADLLGLKFRSLKDRYLKNKRQNKEYKWNKELSFLQVLIRGSEPDAEPLPSRENVKDELGVGEGELVLSPEEVNELALDTPTQEGPSATVVDPENTIDEQNSLDSLAMPKNEGTSVTDIDQVTTYVEDKNGWAKNIKMKEGVDGVDEDYLFAMTVFKKMKRLPEGRKDAAQIAVLGKIMEFME